MKNEKIKFFIGNSPEEIEREFNFWRKGKTINKIHFKIYKDGYNLLIEYSETPKYDCEQ